MRSRPWVVIGASKSKGPGPLVILGDDPALQRAYALAALRPSDLKALFKQFQSIDVDDSNSVDVSEFYHWLGVPGTGFATGIFDLIDKDMSYAAKQMVLERRS